MTAVVEVNEVAIFATRMGSDWWVLFRSRQENRIDVVKGSIGDLVHVRCDDREHADWLANHMLAQGIPKSAIKIPRANTRCSPKLVAQPTGEADRG